MADPRTSVAEASERGERLRGIAAELESAVGLQPADPGFRTLEQFLGEVRSALDMDVVFASEFVDDQRVFRCVSADSRFDVAILPGYSNPLLDTYCKLIVDGRIPRVVEDAQNYAELRRLGVTRVLRIAAYIGVPIVLANGSVFGTLCCISRTHRPDLVASDAAALQLIANAIAASVVDGQVRGSIWPLI